MTTTAEIVAAGRATWDACRALDAQREEMGEARYLIAMKALIGPARFADFIEGYTLAQLRPPTPGVQGGLL